MDTPEKLGIRPLIGAGGMHAAHAGAALQTSPAPGDRAIEIPRPGPQWADLAAPRPAGHIEP